jgi:hypothetical protein
MKLLNIVRPWFALQPFLQARQPGLKGSVEQDRQFGWVHPMILGAVSKEPVLFWLIRYGTLCRDIHRYHRVIPGR